MGTKYKDSGIPWVGVVPNGWEVEPIGRNIHEVDNPNVGGKETNALQFKAGTIISKSVGDSKYHPTTLEAYNVVDEGVIMLNGLNLSFDLISQRVGLVQEKGVITSAYLAIKPNEQIKSEFLTYLFKAYDARKALHAMGKGLRQTLAWKELKSYSVVYPPLPTQQRIADFLDSKCAEIDELAALQETMIAELKRYKQSVITEAVTKGLDPNVPMKDSASRAQNDASTNSAEAQPVLERKFKHSGVEWIGEIPEGWEVIPFKQMYGLGKGLSITKADLVEEGVPVISYGQIHSKSNTGTAIKDELIRYVPTSYLENNQDALVKVGDIIFADTSEDLEGCGNCIYIDKDMTLFAGYHTIIASNRTDTATRYLSYLFKTDCWRIQIRAVVNGVKLFSIPQRTLAATSIITPPLAEQQQIADYLDQKCAEIDELIAIKQQKIEALKEYKKSVIFEYVTGKKEVGK